MIFYCQIAGIQGYVLGDHPKIDDKKEGLEERPGAYLKFWSGWKCSDNGSLRELAWRSGVQGGFTEEGWDDQN